MQGQEAEAKDVGTGSRPVYNVFVLDKSVGHAHQFRLPL